MKITSSAFKDHEKIPKKYTCDGENVNPPLDFDDFPKEVKELALIVDDPDAPSKIWVHWLVYNMPVIVHIDENSIPATEGINDFGNTHYGGPCPPEGTHRFRFRLYALDERLELKEGMTRQQLEKEMEGHILESAELVGVYSR